MFTQRGRRRRVALFTVLWALLASRAALGEEAETTEGDQEIVGAPSDVAGETEEAEEAPVAPPPPEQSARPGEIEFAPMSSAEPQPAPAREQTSDSPATPVGEDAEEEAAREGGGDHCVGHGEARWVYHHLIAGKYNPLGAEWTGNVGVCAPFITRPGMLFDMSHVEFGISHALSPAYGHLGVYVEWAPLSFLVLGTEATALIYWEFPMDRAAYFPVESYRESIDPDDYPPELGQTAGGWNVNVFATVRARIDIGRVGVIAINQLGFEIWRVGDADYYVNLRHDVIMRRFDYLLSNEAMLMAEIPITEALAIRVGAYDSLRYVIEPEILNNNVGLLAMVTWPRNGRWVRGLTPFVRVGWYTHRPEQRRGSTVAFLGVLFDLDLGSARSRSEDDEE